MYEIVVGAVLTFTLDESNDRRWHQPSMPSLSAACGTARYRITSSYGGGWLAKRWMVEGSTFHSHAELGRFPTEREAERACIEDLGVLLPERCRCAVR